MTHWRKLRNEKYLGAWDFELGKEYPFLIDKVVQEKIPSRSGGEDLRPVIYTKTSPKGIVVNVINGKTLEILHGKDYENWVGKYVIVTIRQESVKRETMDVIRFLNKQYQPK